MSFGFDDVVGLASGGTSLLGTGLGVASAYANYKSDEYARDNQAGQFQQSFGENQRQFGILQEQANSAHQREMADLQKAGLNPILTATGGKGNMIGSPVSAPSAGSGGGHPNIDLTKGFSTALTAAKLDSEIDLLKSQAKAQDANALSVISSIPGVLSDNSAKASNARSAEMEAAKNEFTKYLYGKGVKAIDKLDPLLDMLLNQFPKAKAPTSGFELFKPSSEIKDNLMRPFQGIIDFFKPDSKRRAGHRPGSSGSW